MRSLAFYLFVLFCVFSFLFLHKTEEQFSVLWQPTERHRRKRRGLLDESNLDFPPEAALMSINFLTFAVFLIKLVLVSRYQDIYYAHNYEYFLNTFSKSFRLSRANTTTFRASM